MCLQVWYAVEAVRAATDAADEQWKHVKPVLADLGEANLQMLTQ